MSKYWGVLFLTLLLVGCPGGSNTKSGGGVVHDSAPRKTLDPDKIKDAVPKPEIIKRAGNKKPLHCIR